MAIRNFTANPERGLRSAAGSELPNLLVVSGPNGAGKSTLLHQLWRRAPEFAEAGTKVSYMGPHRVWRKMQLETAALYELPDSYRDLIGMLSLPGWRRIQPPGLENIQRPRLHESSDETWSLIKFSMAKKRLGFAALIESQYRQNNDSLPQGSLPDIWGPLKQVLAHLLPHLQFAYVDMNPSDIRVLFTRTDAAQEELVELDDLSSGEKSVIALLFPFLETEIDRVLKGGDEPAPEAVPTAIIDEPDLHLHPILQVSLLEYFRQLADAAQAQFILSTHSPTVLDALRDDELYLLAPTTLVGDGNQFVQVTTSTERLEAIRGLTGGTHLLTRCRPIVYLEGERPQGNSASDQRLVEMLLPESASWALVSAGGRSEAIRAALELREAATENLPGFSIFALVDADQRETGDPDWAVSWPVAMIENLLLEPQAIWNFLEPHKERTSLRNPSEVLATLHGIARELEGDEVRLRVAQSFRPMTVRLQFQMDKDPVGMVAETHQALDSELTKRGGPAGIQEAAARATDKVTSILRDGRELEAFRGKEILHRFFDRYAKNAGFSYKAFVYELARHARHSSRLKGLTHIAVSRISNYVPLELVPALEAAVDAFPESSEKRQGREVIDAARLARLHWEEAKADQVDRSKVRTGALWVAHVARSRGETNHHQALLKALAQIPG